MTSANLPDKAPYIGFILFASLKFCVGFYREFPDNLRLHTVELLLMVHMVTNDVSLP